jgi:hypothetical protein
VDNKVLMMESRTLFIEASTPEPDENSPVLNQIEFTRCTSPNINQNLADDRTIRHFCRANFKVANHGRVTTAMDENVAQVR